MASPHVTGAIALMYSVACTQLMIDYKNNPSGIALMIKDSLMAAADKIASLNGITVSGGRLNLYKSLKAIQNKYSNEVCPPNVSIFENKNANNNFYIKSISPNPTSEKLNVVYRSSTKGKTEFVLANTLGEEINRFNANSTNTINAVTFDLKAISTGIYFLSMQAENKKSNVVKVIVY